MQIQIVDGLAAGGGNHVCLANQSAGYHSGQGMGEIKYEGKINYKWNVIVPIDDN